MNFPVPRSPVPPVPQATIPQATLSPSLEIASMVHKQTVAQTFGQASHNYHSHAQLQKDCAAALLAQVDQWRSRLPSGNILEVGCGTGFITTGLISRFRDRSLEITDLSAEMLTYCQQAVATQEHPAITFEQLDGEQLRDRTYAMIISAFVIQWFHQPAIALRHMLDHLEPGGLLCLSFPSDQSFPEWRQVCQDLGLPMTANPLPNAAALKVALARSANSSVNGSANSSVNNSDLFLQDSAQMIATTHGSAIDFFRALKLIGAGSNLLAQGLSPLQLRQLMQHWNRRSPHQIQVNHHIVYWILQNQPKI